MYRHTHQNEHCRRLNSHAYHQSETNVSNTFGDQYLRRGMGDQREDVMNCCHDHGIDVTSMLPPRVRYATNVALALAFNAGVHAWAWGCLFRMALIHYLKPPHTSSHSPLPPRFPPGQRQCVWSCLWRWKVGSNKNIRQSRVPVQEHRRCGAYQGCLSRLLVVRRHPSPVHPRWW